MAQDPKPHRWARFIFVDDRPIPSVAPKIEQNKLDNPDLEDGAERARKALTNFLKERTQCDRIDQSHEEPESEERLDALRDLNGESASLCMAIRILINLEVKLEVDEMTISLTRRWEIAARETNIEISERLRKLTHTSRIETAKPEGEGWLGSWHLGEGSFGTASLYVQQISNSGSVMNRVVVKECDFNQNEDSRRSWGKDGSLWTSDCTRARVPMEVCSMFDLRGKSGSEYIVKILNWRIASKLRMYRLYLETLAINLRFRPLRDLCQVVEDYVLAQSIASDNEDPQTPQMPEPFLWHVFECLCIAGLLLERGTVERNPMRNWQTIVHRDLRPANTFLGIPDKHIFAKYPTPKIGDFGLAVNIGGKTGTELLVDSSEDDDSSGNSDPPPDADETSRRPQPSGSEGLGSQFAPLDIALAPGPRAPRALGPATGLKAPRSVVQKAYGVHGARSKLKRPPESQKKNGNGKIEKKQSKLKIRLAKNRPAATTNPAVPTNHPAAPTNPAAPAVTNNRGAIVKTLAGKREPRTRKKPTRFGYD